MKGQSKYVLFFSLFKDSEVNDAIQEILEVEGMVNSVHRVDRWSLRRLVAVF